MFTISFVMDQQCAYPQAFYISFLTYGQIPMTIQETSRSQRVKIHLTPNKTGEGNLWKFPPFNLHNRIELARCLFTVTQWSISDCPDPMMSQPSWHWGLGPAHQVNLIHRLSANLWHGLQWAWIPVLHDARINIPFLFCFCSNHN